MKVMQINCVYNRGSTGKLVMDLHKGIQSEGHDSLVVFGRGKSRVDDPSVFRVSNEMYSKLNNLGSRISGLVYGGCYWSTKQIISIINNEKPDVIHVQCINGFFVNIYDLISFLKKENYPTIVTLHAEFMFTANCSHSLDCEKWKSGCGNCPNLSKATNSLWLDRTAVSWKKMQEAFTGFNRLHIVAVSDWLKNRSLLSPFLGQFPTSTIFNGVDTDLFYYYPREEVTEELTALFNLVFDSKTILHVTAGFTDDPNHIKGGNYLIELAELLPDCQFVVVGKYFINGIIPNNIKLLGEIIDRATLAKLYSVADITVLTSRRETFSMVCAESLCCGTPVVGFKAGGPETISLPEFSSFCDYGDIDGLMNLLKKFPAFDSQIISETAIKAYDKKTMIRQYINLYNNMCNLK